MKKYPFRILEFAFLITYLGSSASTSFQNGDIFDFIVVGAGTAGCAVARRLAQSGRHTVLLIEEGGNPHPNQSIPAFYTHFFGNPDYFRLYETVPQRNAALAQNGNLLPYFRRYENYLGNNPSNQRGFNGPISVSPPRFTPGLSEWLEAGRELGYPVADPNGPQEVSFAILDFSQRDGRRSSSFTEYIRPTLQPQSGHDTLSPFNSTSFLRRNVLLSDARVNRIHFRNSTAVGVRFNGVNGANFFARARKEVILSAGTIETALLLMRSGVGPRSMLRRANIPVRRNLPVGRNLQDHPQLATLFIIGNKSAVFDAERDLTPENWNLYERTGNGPYSSFMGLSATAFLVSDGASNFEKAVGWSDTYIYASKLDAPAFVLASPIIDDLEGHETTVTLANVLGRTRTRGRVTINPENVRGPPLIDFRYYQDPHDMQVMVYGIKFLVELCENTAAFQRLGCRLPTFPIDACSHLDYPSDPYWECYVREGSTTGYHPTGTCRMGRGPRDPLAVVDSRLRVIGLDRLRVVDASIMPEITNANTQAPVYAIAEKGADMILRRWR